MAIRVTCPECNHAFAVRDEYAGKRGKCPKCRATFVAPSGHDEDAGGDFDSLGFLGAGSSSAIASSATTESVASPPARGGKRKAAAAPRGAKRGKSQSSGGAMPIWGWALIAVVVLAGAATGAVVYNAKSQDLPPELPPSEQEKKFVEEYNSLEKQIVTLEKEVKNRKNSRSGEPERGSDITQNVIPAIVKVVRYKNENDKEPDDITGSGFFVNDDQWIITSHRIVENAAKLKVIVGGVAEYDVEGYLGGSDIYDLAVIKLKAKIPNLKPLKLADPSIDLEPGNLIYAIGNPGHHRGTLRRGIVTRLLDRNQLLKEKHEMDLPLAVGSGNVTYIEHDARIFPGDYGTPLMNEKLEVVGVQSIICTMHMNDRRIIVQTFGMGVHAKHIPEILKMASSTVKPYPKGPEIPPPPSTDPAAPPDPRHPPKKPEKKPPEKKPDDGGEEKPGDEKPEEKPAAEKAPELPAAPDAKQIVEFLEAAAKIVGSDDWGVNGESDYKLLKELARGVTLAIQMSSKADASPELRQAAQKALGALNHHAGEFGDESNAKQLNELATADVEADKNGKAGFVGTGIVRQTADRENERLILIELVGVEKFIFMQVPVKMAPVDKGTQMVIVGQYTGETKGFKRPGADETEKIPVVHSYTMMQIKKR
jgi:S1-C subfamily serine protease